MQSITISNIYPAEVAAYFGMDWERDHIDGDTLELAVITTDGINVSLYFTPSQAAELLIDLAERLQPPTDTADQLPAGDGLPRLVCGPQPPRQIV